MDLQKQLAALRLFNEKVQELLDLSFVQAVSDPRAGLTFRVELRDDQSYGLHSEVRGPSQEAIRAFVLTFRFFIQDNETIALRNMASVYDIANVSPELKAQFKAARDSVNSMLDSPNLLNFSYNDNTLTNRTIMDVFVYGGLAHATPQKYQQFKEWVSIPPAKAILWMCFTMVLGLVLQALAFIAQVNERAIEELTSGSP